MEEGGGIVWMNRIERAQMNCMASHGTAWNRMAPHGRILEDGGITAPQLLGHAATNQAS